MHLEAWYTVLWVRASRFEFIESYADLGDRSWNVVIPITRQVAAAVGLPRTDTMGPDICSRREIASARARYALRYQAHVDGQYAEDRALPAKLD